MVSAESRDRLAGWRIVVGATIGMAMSPGTVAFYSLGLFMHPISQDYGWTRSEIAFVTTILTIGIVVTMPIVGFFLDRFGPRRVLIPSLTFLSLGLMAIVFVDSLWEFYAAFAFIGVAGAGANSPAYIKALSAWFDRRRGLVIGIASAGMGLGVMLMPGFIHVVTELRGWKSAYAGLGLAILLIGLPSVALLLRDAPGESEGRPYGEVPERGQGTKPEPYGYPLRECIRMRQFWTLLLLFTFVGGSLNAVAVHLVAMMEDRGSAAPTAVMAASLFGGAMMGGRLVTGYLMDRFFAPVVAAIFFLGALIGMSLLMSGAAEPWLLLASILIGLCAGAEGDVLGFLISRYFGLRSMGKVYGYIFSAYLIGVSICPYLMGVGYELTSSYALALGISMLLILASVLLVLRLGPYPVFSKLPAAT